MSSEEPIEGKCGAPTYDGGYCENDPVDGDKCGRHCGTTYNGNMRHGIYAGRQNYYETCNDKEKAWIDSVVGSFLDDAPFDETDFGKYQKLRNIAIDMHKVRNANQYVAEEGIKKEKVVGYNDDGQPIMEEDEHELNVAIDRLNRTTTKELKELGVLDDPDSQKAESQSSIAKQLSKINDDS